MTWIVLVVQSLGHVQLFVTPWTQNARLPCPSLSPWVCSIESGMPFNHLILCNPFSSCPQSFPALGSFPMGQIFASWPKYWSFSFSLSPSNEYSGLLGLTGLIYFQSKRLLSLLQHHSLKTSILWCSAFFIVQLSHPYTTTGKTIALTRRTFVGKVMSLLLPQGVSHGGSEKSGKLEVGGASRDSIGFGALEEGLISSWGRNLRVPLISDSSRRVPADWGQESQASSWVEAWNSACLSRCPHLYYVEVGSFYAHFLKRKTCIFKWASKCTLQIGGQLCSRWVL